MAGEIPESNSILTIITTSLRITVANIWRILNAFIRPKSGNDTEPCQSAGYGCVLTGFRAVLFGLAVWAAVVNVAYSFRHTGLTSPSDGCQDEKKNDFISAV